MAVTSGEPTQYSVLGTQHFRGPYGLTEEQELFKRTVHEFAEREIVPVAHELDEKEENPRATVAKRAELGLLGLLVPEGYGGASPPPLAYRPPTRERSC